MAFKGKITISELSRILNISRPTLYKYVEEYECEFIQNIPDGILEIFDYIYSDKSYDKNDIMQFCIANHNSNTKDFVIDKIKMLMKVDDNFTDELIKFIDSYYKNDFRKRA